MYHLKITSITLIAEILSEGLGTNRLIFLLQLSEFKIVPKNESKFIESKWNAGIFFLVDLIVAVFFFPNFFSGHEFQYHQDL